MSARGAAKLYGVNRGTIKSRLNGQRSRAEFSEGRHRFTPEEELAILKYINDFCSLGFPPRLYMVCDKASHLLHQRGDSAPLGVHWTDNFLSRYPEYRTKFPRNLDQERHWNSESEVFRNWFKLFKRTMARYDIAPCDVWNMDEKSYMIGVGGNKQRKVIVRRSEKNAFSVHSGDRS